MSSTFRWGILGLGKIAHKFAQDIQLIESAEVFAVASRSKTRAKEYAEKYGATYAFDSYEAMAKCKEVDAVYIATPHTSHYENTLLCLENKLPVLCEKAFAINSKQVKQMIESAKKNDTFLMEALWTRFLPAYKKMLEIVDNRQLGDLLNVRADFSFKAPFNPERRVFNRKLGGGALLDIGIYPVFLTLSLFGKPNKIEAVATFGQSNVDESCAMIFQYSEGKLAFLDASFRYHSKTEAYIYGEKGTIHLPSRFHQPKQIIIELYHNERQEFNLPYMGNGYYHEALEVMNCLAKGKKESDSMSLQFSLEMMEVLDAIREKASISYPAFD